jgi:hypothetical protein
MDKWTLENERPICHKCLRPLRDGESMFLEEEGVLCESCYNQSYNQQCWSCRKWFRENDMKGAHDHRREKARVCRDCFEKYFETCDVCFDAYLKDMMKPAVASHQRDIRVCPECFKTYERCNTCGRYLDYNLINENGECIYCHKE